MRRHRARAPILLRGTFRATPHSGGLARAPRAVGPKRSSTLLADRCRSLCSPAARWTTGRVEREVAADLASLRSRKQGPLSPAALQRIGAAGMEQASIGPVVLTRHYARDRLEPGSIAIALRQRGEQRLGVRMLWRLEDP